MQQKHRAPASFGRTCLTILGLTLAFVVVLAVMLFLVIAAGDPDNPLLSMAIVSPIALVLILMLVMRRSRRQSKRIYAKEAVIMHFGQAPRFEVLPDATIIARAGTQTNCGGIARIHVRITSTTNGQLSFDPPYDSTTTDDVYDGDVPGCAVPDVYRAAVFRGAQTAFACCNGTFGVHFEILDALVHPVDARESQFARAGFTAMKGWITTYFPSVWQEHIEEDA